jgi:ribonuclease G
MRLWATIETSAKKAKSPALIYQEAELPLRVTRDLFTGDFERLLVDHDRTHKRIVGYLKKTSPHMVERVTRYKEREPLLEAFGVEQEIKSTLSRRVDLPSGGYLIFDYAEAFTVIDVNTGRFVGSRSKRNGPGRLEDTITKNNLEAVKEVVRQLRLRDVGGIIVIDFIDMANPKNRQQVEDALRQELERDRTKTYVVEISPLGLVEMTRQNVTDGPREVMTRKCPTCDGDGIVVSESTAAVEVERRIRALVTPGSRAKAFKVELNAKIAELLVGPDGTRLQELEEVTKRRFFLVGVEDVHLDHMRVIDQGTVEKLAPAAPVEPGEELELKLGEVGLHDAHAGAGKVKGFEVVVAGAAKLVGKRVRVRITAVLEDVAYAVLAGAEELTAPITAEAEAEKPTRAKRPVKAAEAEPEAEIETEPDLAEEDAEEPVDAQPAKRVPRKPAGARAAASRSQREPVAEDDDAEPDTSSDAPAAKRPRTRKPAVAVTAEPAHTAETVDEGAEPETEAADGETPTPVKKRTRRGTRGGRNRKRKPTAATNGEIAAEADDRDESADREAEEPAAPVIHLPERDLGRNGDEPAGEDETDGGEPASQRRPTRRGSRGGRNRRRTPATTGTESDTPPEATPETVATAEPEGEWKYTPMSEWGDS